MGSDFGTAWPPSAALEGEAHKEIAGQAGNDEVGGIAPKGRTGTKSAARERQEAPGCKSGVFRTPMTENDVLVCKTMPKCTPIIIKMIIFER